MATYKRIKKNYLLDKNRFIIKYVNFTKDKEKIIKNKLSAVYK